MNVTLPKKEKVSKRRIAVYVSVILVCVIALIVAVCVQILGNDFTNKIFGVSRIKSKTEEEEQTLRANFDKLFSNTLEISGDTTVEISKIDKEKEYIITRYSKNENISGSYEVSLQIPYINIDSEAIKKCNDEIEKIFQKKAESVLESKDKNILFTIEYQGYIENNILSLIIKSNLKQGANAQQIVVQTYNYDLVNKKEITLEEEMELLGLDKNAVQNKIKEEIKEEEDKAKALQDLGYDIFARDSKSEMYDIENSNIFFFHNQNLYIIYPYGNDALTSEMDMVIV